MADLIYAQLREDVKGLIKLTEGLTTDTAETIVDNENKTVKVNVLKVPGTLTIEKDGESVVFDGSEDVQLEVDSTPTTNSINLVTSGGVKDALDLKADKVGPLPSIDMGPQLYADTNLWDYIHDNDLSNKYICFNLGGTVWLANFITTYISDHKYLSFEIDIGAGSNSSYQTRRFVGTSVLADELTLEQINGNITYREDYQIVKNKVTSLNPGSTNEQYPSAKCVWDITDSLQTDVNAKVNKTTTIAGIALSSNISEPALSSAMFTINEVELDEEDII